MESSTKIINKINQKIRKSNLKSINKRFFKTGNKWGCSKNKKEKGWPKCLSD